MCQTITEERVEMKVMRIFKKLAPKKKKIRYSIQFSVILRRHRGSKGSLGQKWNDYLL